MINGKANSWGNFLEQLWKENSFHRRTMIVKRGDDSSSWNHAANAWNKARDNWINLLYATGMESALDQICFGKAMRLMAGDIAYWHETAGNSLDPNTQVSIAQWKSGRLLTGWTQVRALLSEQNKKG